MPHGPTPLEPKTTLSTYDATGRPVTGRFQGLSAGKMGQLGAPGKGWPPAPGDGAGRGEEDASGGRLADRELVAVPVEVLVAGGGLAAAVRVAEGWVRGHDVTVTVTVRVTVAVTVTVLAARARVPVRVRVVAAPTWGGHHVSNRHATSSTSEGHRRHPVPPRRRLVPPASLACPGLPNHDMCMWQGVGQGPVKQLYAKNQ